MSSSRKGMLNVLIAAVLWGSSGVCAQYIMEQSQMSSQFLTMTRLIFAGFILLTLSFVHGDKVFSVLQNRHDALRLLIFSIVGALTVQLTFLLTIEKSNAATATVLQFLSPTIIVAWFAIARKARPGILVLTAIFTSLIGTFFVGHSWRSHFFIHFSRRAFLGNSLSVCRRVLYHLPFHAYRPLRDVTYCRLEYVIRWPDSSAFLRQTRHSLYGEWQFDTGLFLSGGDRYSGNI